MSNNQAGGTPNVTPSSGGCGVNTQDNQETNTGASFNENNNTQSTENRINDRRSQTTRNERTWQGENLRLMEY